MRYFTNVKEMLHAHNNNEQSHNLIGHGNRAKKINLTVSCREVTLPGHKTRACAGQSLVAFPELLLEC